MTSEGRAEMDEMTGIERIAAERRRQVTELGYTAEHDAEHTSGELAGAAAAYADYAVRQIAGTTMHEHQMLPSAVVHFVRWSDDPIDNLVRAGALIAAEIDRLLAAKKGKEADA